VVAVAACGGGDSDGVVDVAPTTSTTSSSTTEATLPDPTSMMIPSSQAKSTATAIPKASSATAVLPNFTATPLPAPTVNKVPAMAPTVQPTSTVTPAATPTIGPPTPIPTATPIGFSEFSGNGSAETKNFISPPRLPWLIEWDAKGQGANSITVTLMDPESKTAVNELVSDSGTGDIGGVNLVVGNLGTFYLKVEGPESGWTIWITQQ